MVQIFNELFQHSYNTVLVRGEDEPIYLPADDSNPYHRVVFAHGFYASCLHEISHWCIAGPERRKLEDFGYWYQPDGRSAEQQSEFEKVEIKPQALEWILAKACGFKFRVSADNLSGVPTDNSRFKENVYQQVLCYLEQGLAERPRLLVEKLAEFYQLPTPQAQHFSFRELHW
ncbi:MAG: elongation factor P hydroxylase [Motiliproteus sp.]|nr:elongation factor P hydroxylase [Motiliproteus sp.]MCW9052548.1 elongation factor P hydroxylase [Motiliproteus sp.]